MKKGLSILTCIAMVFFLASGAWAVHLTAGSGTGAAGGTVTINVTVDNATGIAGAAFTLQYDTSVFSLDSVDSNFFSMFSEMESTYPNWPQGETSVTVDSTTYDQAVVGNDVSGTGLKLAGANPEEATSGQGVALFSVTLAIDAGAAANDYTVSIIPTYLDNESAGYTGGMNIDALIGADPNEQDLSNAFPVRLAAADVSANVTSGTITVTGGGDVGAPGSGDTDNDGVVDLFDLLDAVDLMTDDYGDNPTAKELACDMDGDGDIDLFDLLAMIDAMPN